ncbi:MAG: polysaccharide biosynthesis tyrosine autokinase [Gammaproteobacteria bacterium]|nr:polysaccharide biosynthesis tyrosine autokinase [Gammaproteobacteria bacterium]
MSRNRNSSHNSRLTTHGKAEGMGNYFAVLRRNLLTIISFSILSTVIGYFWAANIPPAYRTSVTLVVDSNKSAQYSIHTPVGLTRSLNYEQAQIELIRSRAVAEAVISNLGLKKHADFLPQKKGMLDIVISKVTGANQEAKISREERDEGLEEIPIYIKAFAQRLDVAYESAKSIIRISYESTDKVIAAKVANEIVAVYLEVLKKVKNESDVNTAGWLSARLEEVRKTLVQSEARLKAFQVEKSIVDSNDENSVRSSKLGGITSQIVKARAMRADAEAVYNEAKKIVSASGVKAISSIVDDDQLLEAKLRESDANREVSLLSKRYGEKHPKMKAARSRYQQLSAQAKAEAQRVFRRVKRSLDLALEQEKETDALYKQLQQELASTKDKQFELAKMEMDVSTNRELYDLLLMRLKEADINRADNVADVRVLDPAAVPSAPYKPNRTKIMLFSFLIGFGLSLGMAVIREANDPTFKTAEDLLSIPGVPVLGIMPQLSRREIRKYSAEKIAVGKSRSSAAEAINNIRTNVIFSSSDRAPKITLVTSAVASEGKTTVSSNLAISMSMLGPTLLIEADTRRPRVGEFMKGKVLGGIFEYVAGKHKLKDCVVKDDAAENLYVMPVKTMPANPLEMFSSKRFDEVLKKLSKKFEYIVIDSPPVLPVSDSIVISSKCDGVVLVVGAESTHKKAVYGALDRLNRAGARVLGTVLSMANIRTIHSYGDHYYYGYEKYQSDGKMPKLA